MQLPNPIGSRNGRMLAFFMLYITEGIPYGFTSVVMIYLLKEQGLENSEISQFKAALYFPWSWKWVAGPFVDLISFGRHGHRRMWIIICQTLMVATLMIAMPLDFERQLQLLIAVILIHNIFAATQDVAIDAMACNVLKEDERGLANGLMFAGTYLGSAIGGGVVLKLAAWIEATYPDGSVPTEWSYFFVGGAVLLITIFVVVPIREERRSSFTENKSVYTEVVEYLKTALKSMFASRRSFFGLLFAMLPMGPHALSMMTQEMASDFNVSTDDLGTLQVCSTICSAIGCVCGGLLSDRFGRKRMLAFFIVLGCLPTLLFGWKLGQFGWNVSLCESRILLFVASDSLINWFWICTLSFAFIHGMMYGSRSALFMDVSNPAVAAIQFTGYMAVLNLVLSYTALWQGPFSEDFGYGHLMLADCGFGLLGLVFLPLIIERKKASAVAE